MSYVRLNKTDGDIFNASDVTHIEDGIIQNESDISLLNDSLENLNANFPLTGSMVYYNFSASESIKTQVDNTLQDGTCALGFLPYNIIDGPNNEQGYNAIIFRQDSDYITILAFPSEPETKKNIYIMDKTKGEWNEWKSLVASSYLNYTDQVVFSDDVISYSANLFCANESMGIIQNNFRLSAKTYSANEVIMTLPVTLLANAIGTYYNGSTLFIFQISRNGNVIFNSETTLSSNTYIYLNMAFPIN